MPKKRPSRPRAPLRVVPAQAPAQAPTRAPKPPATWKALLSLADDAHIDGAWGKVAAYLRQARAAPDAPDVTAGPFRSDVDTWQALSSMVAEHQGESRAMLRGALGILVADAQHLYGAAGAPNPTTEELCEWLLTAVESLDMERVDEAVEASTLPRTYLCVQGFAGVGAAQGGRP
jgi:hypothetical protein